MLMLILVVGLITKKVSGLGIIEFDLLDGKGVLIETHTIDTIGSHVIYGENVHKTRDILLRRAPEGLNMFITVAGSKEDIVLATLAEISPSTYPHGIHLTDVSGALNINRPMSQLDEWIKIELQIQPFFITHGMSL